MRLHVVVIAVAACALLALPAAAQEIPGGARAATSASPAGIDAAASGQADPASLDRFRAAYPEAQFFAEGGRVTQIYGATISYGTSAEESAQSFLRTSSTLFGVQADELQPGNAVDAQHIVPLLYDETSGVYKGTMVSYRQYKDGIPVYGADVRMLVVNEPSHPLVLANSTLCDLSDFTVPPGTSIDPGAAQTAAIGFEPGLSEFSPPEVVIWPDLNNKPSTPQVAITFVGSGVSANGAPKKWRFVCSAATGQILHSENMILFTDVSGTITGLSTPAPKAEQCSTEVSMPMPYATASISGGSSVYADVNGNFTIPNGGTTAVTVQSPMSGHYFTVTTASGGLDSLSMSVTPPGPANFVHNSANTSESIRAQVNVYVQGNRVRDWVLVQNPSYPTIATQTGFPLNVMLSTGYCPGNAWYDGVSLNFCSANSTYGDTAFSNVLHHEYGHHVVDSGGSGQGQYGEGLGDCLSVVLADDPKLGVGFFTSDCTNGIRNADNTMQYPCSSDIHTCAQLLSGCIWSTRNALVAGGHSDYLAVLAKLLVNSVPLHGSGSSITPAIGTTFISLDNTYYAGAHVDHITTGFSAHNMIPAAPPANDACANAIVVCPGTYSGTNSGASVDALTSTASCDGSPLGPDVWYKYTPGSSGSATISLCSSTTIWDSVLSVHTGSCPGTAQIGCNDDGCSSGSAHHGTLTLSLTGGTTYLIRVAGYDSTSATGPFTLTITGPACASSDTTAPTPNPMTFASAPVPASTTSISMTASTATDTTSPPVSYYFNFVSGGTGGNDSAWQSSTSYTDSGLTANTGYTYRVKARDSASPPNETTYSGNASTATLIETPTGISFGTVATGSIVLNASGTLSNLTTGSSGLYFDSTTTGGDGGLNVWQQTTSDTATGLSPNTSYTFQVKARNQNSVETAYSGTASKATLIETPTGISFGTVAADSIVLNATGTLSNLTSGSSGLYFNSTTPGGNGGLNVWQQTASDTATGLSPNTSYTFQVKARNQEAVETAYSNSVDQVTLANVPAAPTLSNATSTTLDLDVNANDNPAATEFAVMCTASNPTDANWDGQYVDATGAASATAVWQTEPTWGTVTVQGLQACTTYTFAVKARNSDLAETAFGDSASLSVGGASFDMNADGIVDGNDIQPFTDCVTVGGPGCACVNTDVTAFVSCLLDAGMCP